METTAADGKNYPTKYYNLDAVIAVGYRVNSKRATAFRIWATNILKEYIKKDFAMDDDRLKELGGGVNVKLNQRFIHNSSVICYYISMRY